MLSWLERHACSEILLCLSWHRRFWYITVFSYQFLQDVHADLVLFHRRNFVGLLMHVLGLKRIHDHAFAWLNLSDLLMLLLHRLGSINSVSLLIQAISGCGLLDG